MKKEKHTNLASYLTAKIQMKLLQCEKNPEGDRLICNAQNEASADAI